jgi:hypothetical protein
MQEQKAGFEGKTPIAIPAYEIILSVSISAKCKEIQTNQ